MIDDHLDIISMVKKVVLMAGRPMETVRRDEEDEKLIMKVRMDQDIEKMATMTIGIVAIKMKEDETEDQEMMNMIREGKDLRKKNR